MEPSLAASIALFSLGIATFAALAWDSPIAVRGDCGTRKMGCAGDRCKDVEDRWSGSFKLEVSIEGTAVAERDVFDLFDVVREGSAFLLGCCDCWADIAKINCPRSPRGLGPKLYVQWPESRHRRATLDTTTISYVVEGTEEV